MKDGITKKEYARTIDFFECITKSDSSSFQKNVLLAMADFFHYEHATFFITDDQGDLTEPVLLNIDQSFMHDYLDYYYTTDIFYPNKNIGMDYYKKKAVLSITDLMSYKQFEETEFYNDFLKKQNLYHELALALFHGEKMVGGIGLFKPKGENFTVHDIQRVKSLSKCISNLLHKNMELKRELQCKKLYEVSFSSSPVGMVIFNKKLDIIYANSRSLLLGQIIFSKNVTEQELVKLIIEQMGNHWFYGGDKTLLSPTLNVYTARILSLAFNQGYGQNPTFLLTITPETAITSLQKGGYSNPNAYNLTKRELEILPFVLQGMTNQEIADELYITPVTVKAHLQRIFKKMGVNNRTSLCHKLNNIIKNK